MATAGVDIPDRNQTIARHRKAGGAIAAVFPIHYPRALLRAFDLLPVEVWGPPGRSTTSGDAHLQAYTCSIVRCSLSFVLDGKLDDAALDGAFARIVRLWAASETPGPRGCFPPRKSSIRPSSEE